MKMKTDIFIHLEYLFWYCNLWEAYCSNGIIEFFFIEDSIKIIGIINGFCWCDSCNKCLFCFCYTLYFHRIKPYSWQSIKLVSSLFQSSNIHLQIIQIELIVFSTWSIDPIKFLTNSGKYVCDTTKTRNKNNFKVTAGHSFFLPYR